MATDTATGAERGIDDETELGLDPNVLGAIAYLFGLVSGVVLLVVEDNDFVHHHAAQSVLFSVAVGATFFVLSVLGGVLGLLSNTLGTIFGLLTTLLWLATGLLSLFLMFKAYSGEAYALPVLGDYIGSVRDVF